MSKIIINGNHISGTSGITIAGVLNNISTNVAIVTSSTNVLTSSHIILASASVGDINLTLPNVLNSKYAQFIIKKIDSTNNVINIIASGSQTIDDISMYSLTTKFDSVSIVNDATGSWFVL